MTLQIRDKGINNFLIIYYRIVFFKKRMLFFGVDNNFTAENFF